MNRTTWFIAGVLATLGFGAAVAFGVIAGGAYDVSATSGHGGLVRSALHGAMENGVARRAPSDEGPPATAEAIAAGAGEYKAMCQTCHGGPGVERAIWAGDLEPSPPDLADEAEEWSRAEIYWIVANGIKMTGMPAFGPTHDEATVWNIASFVKAMPDMTAAQYAALGDAAHGHGEDEAAHDESGTAAENTHLHADGQEHQH